MDFKVKVIASSLVVIALVYWFVSQTSVQNQPETHTVTNTQTQNTNNAGQQQDRPLAPDFTLKDMDGKSVSLSDYRGKVVFVNFWATWCPPCRAEIPDFVKLVDKYGKEGFVILGVSVDKEADVKKIPKFSKDFKINYPVMWDSNYKVAQDYGGIGSIPTTFVIDRSGRAVGKVVGARSYKEFEKIIKKVL